MSVVPLRKRHIDHRGDPVSIIQSVKLGNTTVMISDKYLPKSLEQCKAIEQHMIYAMWYWWDSLTTEEQIAYNESVS